MCSAPNAVDRTKSVTFVQRVRDEIGFVSAATESKEGVLPTATAAATAKNAEKRIDCAAYYNMTGKTNDSKLHNKYIFNQLDKYLLIFN